MGGRRQRTSGRTYVVHISHLLFGSSDHFLLKDPKAKNWHKRMCIAQTSPFKKAKMTIVLLQKKGLLKCLATLSEIRYISHSVVSNYSALVPDECIYQLKVTKYNYIEKRPTTIVARLHVNCK